MNLDHLTSKLKDWEDRTLSPFQARSSDPRGGCTPSSHPVRTLYTALDAQSNESTNRDEFPGRFPFTRGIYPNMYQGRVWTMRQYAGFGTAEESNRRYRYLLQQGQSGLSVAFDLPTQIGYDSDAPLAEGEVGKVGVAIDSLADMELLFEEIPMQEVSTSMTINATAAILLAMYVVVGEKQGVRSEDLRGTLQNDILKEYIARGTYIYPPQQSMRLIVDTLQYCSEKLPKYNPISISGYHIREAGSTASQEIAFTLGNAIAYCEAAIQAGLAIDEFAPRLSFFFNAHNDLFEEVSKFRAARRLWANIVKDRFKTDNPKSLMLRFHTQTAGSTLTAQQPENNVVRVALQALAAVLGGTQSLHTNSRDEALALPSQDSVQIALATQQILAYESGITNTVDPLGGSYFVEATTDRIETEVMELLERIDSLGGMVSAIEQGFVQRQIQDSAYQYQKEIETQERVVVGSNRFQVEEVPPTGLLRVDPNVRELQTERIKSLKESRDEGTVESALSQLQSVAQGDGNLMPPILEAVRAYATVGEISQVMRNVFGEYRQEAYI